MKSGRELTAAQEILLAAAKIADERGGEFSEWDLTVSTWTRNKNRFGCRGYEAQYPDHKRVMMEIMGKSKKDNPLRRGWFEKSRPNFYRITPLGAAEAQRLFELKGMVKESIASPQPVYDAVYPYYEHRAFRDYCRDTEEPRMWLSAASFLGITRNDRVHFLDRLRAAETAVKGALEWLHTNKQDQLRRGVSGGGPSIRIQDLKKLADFFNVIRERFKVQLDVPRRS